MKRTIEVTLGWRPPATRCSRRILEFHNTGNSEYALQAIHAVRALSEQLDRDRLSAFILREGVADAAAVLMALVERPGTITVALLAYAHEVATRRRPWCDLRDLRNGPR